MTTDTLRDVEMSDERELARGCTESMERYQHRLMVADIRNAWKKIFRQFIRMQEIEAAHDADKARIAVLEDALETIRKNNQFNIHSLSAAAIHSIAYQALTTKDTP